MRKAVPILVVLGIVGFVVWATVLNRPPGAPGPPTGVTPPPHNKNVDPGASGSATIDVPRPSDPAVAAVMDEMLAAWDKVSAVTAKVETNMPEAAGHEGRT